MSICGYQKLINWESLEEAFKSFHGAHPFDHCAVDQFVRQPALEELESEFLPFDSPKWLCYSNAVEQKKALNDWNAFPPATYRFFTALNGPTVVDKLSDLAGVKLHSDNGVHGGGWHIHGPGGNLNPHLDYSLHPKLGLQRKLNIIIYLSRELEEKHGGHLGFWESAPGAERPGKLIKEIEPRFNRAVIFDTTQNSWHGLSRPLTQPKGVFRKSLAVYYMCDPPAGVDERSRALFAPREDQLNDPYVKELIKLRSGVDTSARVYIQH